MELFSNRKLKNIHKNKKIYTILGGLVFIIILILIVPFWFFILFLISLYPLYKKITSYSKIDFSKKMTDITHINSRGAAETENIVDELKILYKINYDIKILVYDKNYIDIKQQQNKDTIWVTTGFINLLPRHIKTIFLEHFIFVEKENVWDGFSGTPEIESKLKKYSHILGLHVIRLATKLEQTQKEDFFKLIKSLKKNNQITDIDKGFDNMIRNQIIKTENKD